MIPPKWAVFYCICCYFILLIMFLGDLRGVMHCTLYSVCWMQQLISSQILTSTTVACRIYFMISYTGLTSPSKLSTSLLVWFADRLYSGGQSSNVFEWPLHSGPRHQQLTPTTSQPASTDCTALSADYIRPSGFSVLGTTVWNSLPTNFHDFSVGFGVFRRTVKTRRY